MSDTPESFPELDELRTELTRFAALEMPLAAFIVRQLLLPSTPEYPAERFMLPPPDEAEIQRAIDDLDRGR